VPQSDPEFTIAVPQETYDLLRSAGELLEISDAEVVDRAVTMLLDWGRRPPIDPWRPVSVFFEYGGTRVEGLFLPAMRRLKIESAPLAGRVFATPSAAARAVVKELNPERAQAQGNGWRVWRITETAERIEVLRIRDRDRRRRHGAPATTRTARQPERTT
jgi:hypothetical protein